MNSTNFELKQTPKTPFSSHALLLTCELLEDVLSRLTGGAGNRVLKLLTPFGGGKSHTLASLFHAAGNRKALDVLPEAQGLSRPENVRTAVFDGQFFDATQGKEIPSEKFRAQTMWGWIAWSLAGKKGFELQVPIAVRMETRISGKFVFAFHGDTFSARSARASS